MVAEVLAVGTIDVKDDFPDGFYEALARLSVEFGRFEYEMMLATCSD